MRRFALAIALTMAAGCSGDGGTASSTAPAVGSSTTSATSGPTTSTSAPAPEYDPVTGALAGSAECVPPGGGGATIAWEELRNPIVATEWMAKDQTIRFVDGRWHLWYSSRQPGRGIGYQTSPDLARWTVQEERPEIGGSPDITRDAAGQFVMTHQVDPPPPDDPDNDDLAYRVAGTPEGLSSAAVRPLAPGFFEDTRRIDAAIAHTQWGLFLVFKRGARDLVPQITTMLHSPSGSLDGPWDLLGEPNVGWFENYQLLTIDGRWHMLGTRIPIHVPELWRLTGDPSDPQAWLGWEKVRDLEVPEEAWNGGGNAPGIDYERANSAYLCDARAVDGHFYLFYAGSTELTTFDGRGHAKIGVARSTDLRTWTAP
jgi:hypothetical protein